MDRLGKVCKQLLEEKSNVASGGDAEATNTLLGEVEHLTVAEGTLWCCIAPSMSFCVVTLSISTLAQFQAILLSKG